MAFKRSAVHILLWRMFFGEMLEIYISEWKKIPILEPGSSQLRSYMQRYGGIS